MLSEIESESVLHDQQREVGDFSSKNGGANSVKVGLGSRSRAIIPAMINQSGSRANGVRLVNNNAGGVGNHNLGNSLVAISNKNAD